MPFVYILTANLIHVITDYPFEVHQISALTCLIVISTNQGRVGLASPVSEIPIVYYVHIVL